MKQAHFIYKKSIKHQVNTILGISLILTIFSFICYLFIESFVLNQKFKESINISLYLNTSNPDTIEAIKNDLAAQKYSKKIRFTSKEQATEIWNNINNSDWQKILPFNPLPESIDFTVQANYLNNDSLTKIVNYFEQKYFSQISSIDYPRDMVNNVKDKLLKIGYILLIFAILLGLLMIITINVTIKLYLHSNRFIIKTMQLVGATQSFILKPFIKKSFLQGLISGVISQIVFWSILIWAVTSINTLKNLNNFVFNISLSLFIILYSVIICVISTRYAVAKYCTTEINELH